MPDGFDVVCDWGLSGALAAARSGIERAVVVDVLSFSTTVSVACDRGIEVFPFVWKDDRARAYADSLGAALARGRRHGELSLSPASVRRAAGVSRLVLPSPNGATISSALADAGLTVLAGCLRNATAVAGWLRAELSAGAGGRVAVIAAGERWPDEGLRPAVEDLWGAGAIIAGLGPSSGFRLSPEAEAAAAAFTAARPTLAESLPASVSGQELIGYGFTEDVSIAAEVDSTTVVPRLRNGAFGPA